MDPMAAIRDVFFQECEEQLAELETGLLRMEDGADDPDTVNAVFRAVHSIKGGAGIFSLDALVRFAHVFETSLDGVRSKRIGVTPAVMKLLLRAADALADHVRAGREGGVAEPGKTAALVAEFGVLNAGPSAAKPAAPSEASTPAVAPPAPAAVAAGRVWNIEFTPLASLYAKGNEAALLLRELGQLGRLELDLSAHQLPPLEQMEPDGAYLAWSARLHSECEEAAVRDVFDFADGDCTLLISQQADVANAPDAEDAPEDFEFEFFPMALDMSEAEPVSEAVAEAPEHHAVAGPVEAMAAKAETSSAVSATIRVDLDRVDRLIDLVGELVINEAMLSQRVLEAGIARASGVAMALDELEHLTREIQDSVMAIRAQPVRSVFQRMPRLVREVAAQTGKQVRLLTEGEGTEVDKTVIERIADPLTHMIRNAIDHGLESTEKRLAAGKPAEGVVRLTALHRSGRIVLEVADDGAGINRPRVKAIAAEKGLIAADAQLSDEEIDNLIFLPGFSTASVVSDISGRGVGMDVVRQSVTALGGRISIASRPGHGSTFTLSLPLTLAVLDGMVVSAAGHTLIIPLGTILETLQPRAKDVHALDNELRVLALRGGYVPIVDVGLTLGYTDQQIEAAQSVALLVEGEGRTKAVLLVDAIHGQRQVVIKSLEANYRAVPGIAAATVMGDGRVALILDVDAVVSGTRSDAAREPSLAEAR
jgi:two-component system chemotaxis sensor kinase CheA